jgi:hypothetical protein
VLRSGESQENCLPFTMSGVVQSLRGRGNLNCWPNANSWSNGDGHWEASVRCGHLEIHEDNQRAASSWANSISSGWEYSIGNWGIGILQDDVADDVLIAFEEALANGLAVEEATQRVIGDSPDIDDDDDGPTIYMALAALQLQHGILTPEIQDRAIQAATSHGAIGRFEWDGAPEGEVAARKDLLRRFTKILEHGSCTAEELEQVTNPKEFSLW